MSIEVLAPVGSYDSLVAAVRSGADAVYLGAKSFSARRNATNFDDKQLDEAVFFAHKRNVKVYITVNIMLKDKEIKDALSLINYLYELNVDGIIVQDLGLAKLIHEQFPDLPLHGSTQMSIHNSAALPILKQAGFKRIVVSREMNKQQLIDFCNEAQKYDIEVEHFVHGALCMSVSGQCLLSAMLGQRSGNRGLCAQGCRLPFKVNGGTGYDLSLKDCSLYHYVSELEKMGIASLKIEGRMKRSEYVALATYCCKEAVDDNIVDEQLLKDVFSRSGFTDGYYTGKLGKSMFGIRSQEDVEASKESFNKIHQLYRNERNSVPVEMKFVAHQGKPVTLIINEHIKVEKEIAQIATNRPTTKEDIEKSLAKLGNTPYYLAKCQIDIDDNLFIYNAEVNNMKKQAIEQLLNEQLPKRKHSFHYQEVKQTTNHQLHDYYIRLANIQQLPDNIDKLKGVIIPINSELPINSDKFVVEIPRYINDDKYISQRLTYYYNKGIKKAYCNNIAAIHLAKQANMEVLGGNFLNVANSFSATKLFDLGVNEITTSVELAINEIDDINTNGQKGIIGYGRIPLMLLKNCPLKNGRICEKCDKKGYITDRKNIRFPIRCFLGMSELLNSTPIFLADKITDFRKIDYMILYFTIEEKKEVEEVINMYLDLNGKPKDYTRGLYYRGVM